jgi:tetratricopeptide (TPR) repeat protein
MQTIITEANDKFAKAILLDKKYAFAYLNMACANILLNNPDAALGNIKDLELNGVKNKDSYTLKAIAYYIKGDKKNAMSNFELAKKYNATNSDYNLKLMKSKDSFLNFLPDFSGFIDKYFGDKKNQSLLWLICKMKPSSSVCKMLNCLLMNVLFKYHPNQTLKFLIQKLKTMMLSR